MFVMTVKFDFWSVQPDAAPVLDDASFQDVWRFMNRYAGLRWAWQSPGAWIGFRDGLDAEDTRRFSKERYGSESDADSSSKPLRTFGVHRGKFHKPTRVEA